MLFHRRFFRVNDHVREIAPIRATKVLLNELGEIWNGFQRRLSFFARMPPLAEMRGGHEFRAKVGQMSLHVMMDFGGRVQRHGMRREFFSIGQFD